MLVICKFTDRETRVEKSSDQRVYLTIFRNFGVLIYKMSQLCFRATPQAPCL